MWPRWPRRPRPLNKEQAGQKFLLSRAGCSDPGLEHERSVPDSCGERVPLLLCPLMAEQVGGFPAVALLVDPGWSHGSAWGGWGGLQKLKKGPAFSPFSGWARPGPGAIQCSLACSAVLACWAVLPLLRSACVAPAAHLLWLYLSCAWGQSLGSHSVTTMLTGLPG